MPDAVIITGAAGGIGKVLATRFGETHHVIGIDKRDPQGEFRWIEFDVASLSDSNARRRLGQLLEAELEGADARLVALVNNAAVQKLGSVSELSYEDFQESLFVNLTVPFLISQIVHRQLAANQGSIINIGSIHASLTKPGFVAYATSKAGLSGLTRAMAVDFTGRIRVNAIIPAAIDTPMLAAGFKGEPEKLDMLKSWHPSGRIGRPEEVAALALYLVSQDAGFINGSCIGIDGAISSRLHDPV